MQHTTSHRLLKLLRLIAAVMLVTFVVAACQPAENGDGAGVDTGAPADTATDPLGEDPLAAEEPLTEEPLADEPAADDPLAAEEPAERAQEVDPTFIDFDDDGDGIVTEDEFNTTVEEDFGGEFEMEFSELDTDGNGEITEDEFNAAMGL